MRWYILVPVCFQKLNLPAPYQSAVRSVKVCWYDAMELSLLDRSRVWTRWDLLLLWSKSFASAIGNYNPNFSFDLRNHAYLLAGGYITHAQGTARMRITSTIGKTRHLQWCTWMFVRCLEEYFQTFVQLWGDLLNPRNVTKFVQCQVIICSAVVMISALVYVPGMCHSFRHLPNIQVYHYTLWVFIMLSAR